MNVCKHNPNVPSAFQDRYGLIGAAGFEHSKPGQPECVRRCHADQKFVLDDEDERALDCRTPHEEPTQENGQRSPLRQSGLNNTAAQTLFSMEHRDVQYQVIQLLGGTGFRWTVEVNGDVRSGVAFSREVAIRVAQRVIEKAVNKRAQSLGS